MRQIILLFIFIFCKLLNCQTETTEQLKVSSACDENVLMNYLAEIEITCPETFIEQAVINLETYCRRIMEQLQKINKYLKTCKVADQEDLYISLINGAKTSHKKLCNTPEFSTRFQLYYPCIHELRKDIDGCDGPVDWYEDKDEAQVCNNYKHIVDCYYIKTAKVCGIDAAKTLKELTMVVVDSIITIKCSVSEDPDVKDPMPESYLCGKAETGQSSIKIITFFTFLRPYLI